MTTLHPLTPRASLWQRVTFPLLMSYGVLWLAFVSVLSFLVVTGLSCHLSMRRVDRALLDIQNIGSALKLSWAKTGRYPTTEAGLRALVKQGMLEAIPRDPWNNEYRYLLWLGCPVVWSYGRDGAPGGEGQDADLSSMGSSPPPWILQRAALSTSRLSPRSCFWVVERDLRD